MKNVGFIYTYRHMRDHWLWQEPKKYIRWEDLMMEAVWERTPTRFGKYKIILERGQLVTSVRVLMHRWKTNSKCITDFLSLLESENMIVCDRGKAYTIITMVGYNELQRGQGDDIMPPETADAEQHRLHQGQHDGSPFEEEKKINNKKNSPTLTAQEENLKFFEVLKSDDPAMEFAMSALECTRDRLLKLLQKCTNGVNFKDKRHDGYSDFKAHFLDWASLRVDKDIKKNGRQQSKQISDGAGKAQDGFATRRGTDAKDHRAEDYDKTF